MEARKQRLKEVAGIAATLEKRQGWGGSYYHAPPRMQPSPVYALNLIKPSDKPG